MADKPLGAYAMPTGTQSSLPELTDEHMNDPEFMADVMRLYQENLGKLNSMQPPPLSTGLTPGQDTARAIAIGLGQYSPQAQAAVQQRAEMPQQQYQMQHQNIIQNLGALEPLIRAQTRLLTPEASQLRVLDTPEGPQLTEIQFDPITRRVINTRPLGASPYPTLQGYTTPEGRVMYEPSSGQPRGYLGVPGGGPLRPSVPPARGPTSLQPGLGGTSPSQVLPSPGPSGVPGKANVADRALAAPPAQVGEHAAQQRAFSNRLAPLLELHRKAREAVYGTQAQQPSFLGNLGSKLGKAGQVAAGATEQWLGEGRFRRGFAEPAVRQFAMNQLNMVYQYVKAQTGAQFSITEMDRYRTLFPTVADDEDTASQLYQNMINRATAEINELKKQWPVVPGTNIRIQPGSKSTFNPAEFNLPLQVPEIPNQRSLQDLSDEEFMDLYRRHKSGQP